MNWIPINEALPATRTDVLVWITAENRWHTAWRYPFSTTRWKTLAGHVYQSSEISHWAHVTPPIP